MTTQTTKENRIAEYIEQLEMAYTIEFFYNGDLYSIDATHEKTGDNIYRTDGRGFEVWKFKNSANSGTVIAFSKDANGILKAACFDGKAFVDILDEIESA